MARPLYILTGGHRYDDTYKGATIKADKGVVHTTEGTGMPSYDGGKNAPHYTALPDFAAERLKWVMHFPTTMSARALRNESGGVQTNTEDCVQIELIGTCDLAISRRWTAAGRTHIYWPKAPAWALREVAEFVADQKRRLGIRVEGPEQIGKSWRSFPSSYGKGAPQRFSFTQWNAFPGWCGHQHVPENSHGDPGDLPWATVEMQAKAILARDDSQPPPTGGTGDMDFKTIVPGQTYSVGTALVRGADAQEAVNEGGRTDKRIDQNDDEIAQLKRDLAAAVNRISALEGQS